MYLLKKFKGDLSWIHAREGHLGKPYWPGGRSGITIDPGVDLGYIDQSILRDLYQELMDENQMAEAINAFGVRGIEAERFLQGTRYLKKFRISKEQAEDIFPYVANEYWIKTVKRWSNILNAPSCVHTAILSLTYNRGTENPHLDILNQFFDNNDWLGLGEELLKMQQNHKLDGIRKRRRLEGELIIRNYQKEISRSYYVSNLNPMKPMSFEKL